VEDNKRIYISPGHGGGCGARFGKINEDDIVLGVAQIIKYLLDKQGGYSTMLAREKDEQIPLQSRIRESKKFKADTFLDIHANSHNDTSKRLDIFGFEAHIHDEKAVKDDAMFADRLLGAYSSEFALDPLMRNRGGKESNFYVLRKCPAKANVLFELNFMTHPVVLEFMNSSLGQYRMAKGLFEGIKSYTNIKEKA